MKHHKPACNDCITFSHVSFAYGDTTVLEDISFSIPHGTYVGIIGPNGSGKTTLLKLILGIAEPQQGEIHMGIADEGKPRIGYVPQKVGQGEQMFPATAYEIVATGVMKGRSLFTLPQPKDSEEIAKALEITGVEEFKDQCISDLSGGQQQKVFIARALVGNPDMLILDEPATGIDVASQESFHKLLNTIHKQLDMTILYVSHDIEMITETAEMLVCLNKTLRYAGPAKNSTIDDVIHSMYEPSMKRVTHRDHNH